MIRLIALLALPLAAEVTVRQAEGRIDVSVDGAPFTSFYYGAEAPKPFLHPLRSASGKIVTRRYPMEQVPGESRDHPHHRGLWITHGDVNGLDFWMNEPQSRGNRKGLVRLKRVERARGGRQGLISAVFEWIDPTGGKVLLNEYRTMTFGADPGQRWIDFDVRFEAVEKVKFGDTKEGTFAIRLADALAEKNGGRMVNALGAETMKNVWGKRAPWVDYSGQLDGEHLGIAIFDHPKNPRHPTYWHARDYGLFAANIFGEHDFLADKTRDGSLTLEAGNSLRFRYRVWIHPGNLSQSEVSRQYEQWSEQTQRSRR
jgi:hypothetical protein